MTNTFTTPQPTNINGKDYFGFNTTRGGELEPSTSELAVGGGNATVIAPPARFLPPKEYNSRELKQQEILFTKAENDNNDNANGSWRSRFYVLVGALLFRDGAPFYATAEGYIDELYPNEDVAPYHQGLDADKISASTSLHSLASLLEALVPAVQNEPARQMATIEINRDQYGGVQEHGMEAPMHRLNHVIRRHEFGMLEVDRAKTAEDRDAVRQKAVDLFNDTDTYHGSGYLHDAILAIECNAMMIADPRQDDARFIAFAMNRLNGQINNTLPAELPARAGVRDGLRGRQRTNFVLMHRACVNVINGRTIEVPKTDGECVDYHLPIARAEIPNIANEALAEYRKLLTEDASGDSNEAGLIDLYPAFNADSIKGYEPEEL